MMECWNSGKWGLIWQLIEEVGHNKVEGILVWKCLDWACLGNWMVDCGGRCGHF